MIGIMVPEWTREDDRREAEMFLACPSAWWLDPNRYGNWPDRLDDLGFSDKRLAVLNGMPGCPVCAERCGKGDVEIEINHGDVVSLWACRQCGCEFTAQGETEKSRKHRRERDSRLTALTKPDMGCPSCGSDVAREPWTGDWVCMSADCSYEQRMMSGYPIRRKVAAEAPGSVFDYMKGSESAYPTRPCGCSAFDPIEKCAHQ